MLSLPIMSIKLIYVLLYMIDNVTTKVVGCNYIIKLPTILHIIRDINIIAVLMIIMIIMIIL